MVAGRVPGVERTRRFIPQAAPGAGIAGMPHPTLLDIIGQDGGVKMGRRSMGMEERMTEGPVDADRVARLLFQFYKKRQASLTGPDLAATTLDANYDGAASALCRQIARDLDFQFDAEAREVRALLARRITTLLIDTMRRPQRSSARSTSRITPRTPGGRAGRAR